MGKPSDPGSLERKEPSMRRALIFVLLILKPDQCKIVQMSGTGPTTKGSDVDTKRMKLNDGAWHTVVWEIYGDEMVATVDDTQMVMGKAEGMTPTRSRCELINGGQ